MGSRCAWSVVMAMFSPRPFQLGSYLEMRASQLHLPPYRLQYLHQSIQWGWIRLGSGWVGLGLVLLIGMTGAGQHPVPASKPGRQAKQGRQAGRKAGKQSGLDWAGKQSKDALGAGVMLEGALRVLEDLGLLRRGLLGVGAVRGEEG